MIILALETSAKTCSVALCDGQRLLAHTFLNNGLTHSKTLLPAVVHVLEQCDLSLEQVDVIATAVGPGSFTGLRIGVSTAKGLAFTHDIPCVACSTLASMAWNGSHLEGYTVICAMDARKKQVYHSRFLIECGMPQRLVADSALSLDELAEQLSNVTTPMVVVGDGAKLTYDYLSEKGLQVELAPEQFVYQTAVSVAQEGFRLVREENVVKSCELVPQYHRLSQAERERLEKEKAEKEKSDLGKFTT